MSDSALHQFRIIDLTGGIAGQYGTKYFGDYGADVILVEPPRTGSSTRKTGPFLQDDPHTEKSLLFLYLNNNKRGVSLDISTPSGRDLVFELMRDADVVFEDYAPGHLKSLGLGYEQVRALNPGVVFTSITPFGQYGPYRNYRGNDLLYYALGGMMYTSGSYDREPLKHGHPQTLYMGGMIAAYATSAALFARAATGLGQHIDLSLHEVMASHHYAAPLMYTFTGAIERRAPKLESGSTKGTGFEGIVAAKDGYIGPTMQRGRQRPPFSVFADMIGHPEIADPIFETPAGRQENSAELDAAVMPKLKEQGKFEYFEKAMTEGWVAGVVQTPEDLLRCPQLEERGYFHQLEHPVIGTITIPGEPFKLPASPWELRLPAPLLGQHNQDVYCTELGYENAQLKLLRQQGTI